MQAQAHDLAPASDDHHEAPKEEAASPPPVCSALPAGQATPAKPLPVRQYLDATVVPTLRQVRLACYSAGFSPSPLLTSSLLLSPRACARW